MKFARACAFGIWVLLPAAITAFASPREAAPHEDKIAIDLQGVNGQGLRGPADGLKAVRYEFCIPAGEAFSREVRDIDPTARPMPGSRGRIGCGEAQWLVLGNTHQRAYRDTLERLAALPYVHRIQESFFE